MTTALYDVTVRAIAGKTHKLACVRAVRCSHMGNWFPTIADFMTPDRGAIRAALPHYWRRKAFDRAMTWHIDSTLSAYLTLRDVRNKRVLVTINCEGYERD